MTRFRKATNVVILHIMYKQASCCLDGLDITKKGKHKNT